MERTTLMISRRSRRAAFGAAALALGLLLSWSSGVTLGRYRTSDLTVSTTSDVVDANGGDCATLKPDDLPGPDGFVSLREAICAANNAPGKDTISLTAGVYVLTIHGGDEDLNASGDLDIAGDLDLVGAGSMQTIIDGDGADRVLHIDPQDAASLAVRIEDLTIQGGDADTSFGGGLAIVGGDDTVGISGVHVCSNKSGHDGAGIYNRGDLIIEGSEVSSNTLDVFGFEAFGGGGIYNAGVLSITGTTILSNVVQGGAGGGLANEGRAVIDSSEVSGNRACDAFEGTALGGGIANQGQITLTSCALIANRATDAGGGLYTGNALGAAAASVTGTTFASNTSGGGGGAIEGTSDLDVRASSIISNTSGSGGGGVRLYPAVGDNISVVFAGSAIQDNTGDDRGGGILVRALQQSGVILSLLDSTLEGNGSSSSGGGLDIYLSNGGVAETRIATCTVWSNAATTSDGGGISIWASRGSQALVTLEGSTLRANTAGGSGGALATWASSTSTTTARVTNTTFSGNWAVGDGGGLFGSQSSIHLHHATVTDNRADDDGDGVGDGGGIRASSGFISLTGTIVALNTDGSSSSGAVHPDISGNVVGDAWNLIGDPTGGTGTAGSGTDVVDGAPGLTPLADRGGATPTHGLVPWSPAVDGVPAGACVVSVDQRGEVRPWDGDRDGDPACDSGAFEVYPWWVFVPYVGAHPSP